MRPRPQVGLVWREAIGSRRPPTSGCRRFPPAVYAQILPYARETPQPSFWEVRVQRSRARQFFRHLAPYCQSYRLIWIFALYRAILGPRGVRAHGRGRTYRARLPFGLRDWGAETSHHPRHVVEAALAHTISDSVEPADRRGALLAKRLAALMDDWAGFPGASQSGSWGSQASATGTLNRRHDNQGYHQGCSGEPLAHCRPLPIGPNLKTSTSRLVRALWTSNW
jgi:hypothetical protein